MTALIHGQPDASLYHAHFRFMDAAGRVRRSCGPLPARETAAAWLSDLCRPGARDNLHATGYVARSADYDAVGGIPGFENLLFADYVLWLRLVHRSYKATAPDACFSCRLHERSVSGAADALSYVRAIPPYFDFLNRFRAADPRIAEAFAAHGPDYCLALCRYWYTMALKQANRYNQRLDVDVLATLTAALAQSRRRIGRGK